MNTLIEKIKDSEGFRSEVYQDTLGFDTIGYGTKLPLNRDEAELLLNYRLKIAKQSLLKKIDFLEDLPEDKQDILFEMSYQLGVNGVLKFKKMLYALEIRDYDLASAEMINSKWFNQTKNRASKLAKEMRA